MMSTYETPSTRAEFEERMNFMGEILKQRKLHYSRDVDITDSLLAVRYLPNGRFDLLSIDESVRLQANTTYHMRNMNFDNLGVGEGT